MANERAGGEGEKLWSDWAGEERQGGRKEGEEGRGKGNPGRRSS